MNTIYNRFVFHRLISSFALSCLTIISLLYFFYFFKKGIVFTNWTSFFYFCSLCNNNILSIFSISFIISLQFTIFSIKSENQLFALKISGYKKSTLSLPFFYFGSCIFLFLFTFLFFLSKPIDSRQEVKIDLFSGKIENRLEVERLKDGSRIIFFFEKDETRDLFWLRNDGDIWYVKTFDSKTPGIYSGKTFEKYRLDEKNHMQLIESGDFLKFPYELIYSRKGVHPRLRSLSTYRILEKFYKDKNSLSSFSDSLLWTAIYSRIVTSFIPFFIIITLLPSLFKNEQNPELVWPISTGIFLGISIIWYTEIATLFGASCLLSPFTSFIIIPSILSLFFFYRFCKI